MTNGRESVRPSGRGYWHLFARLTACEILLRDQGTVLGFLWTLLHPALMFWVLYGVAGLLPSGREKGFAGYLLTGLVLWNFVQKATSYSVACFRRNRAVVLGFRFRREIVVLSTAASVGWSSLLETLLLLCILPALGHPPSVRWLLMPVALVLLCAFVSGICLVLARTAADLVDMERVWDLLIAALFYATPVFYRPEGAAAGLRIAVRLNPMTHYLALFRSALLDGPAAPNATWAVCVAGGAASLCAGLIFVRYREGSIAERVMC